MDRVVFHGPNDLFYGMNISKIETITVLPYESITINDAIEYYNFFLYFHDNIGSKVWTEAQIESFREKSISMKSVCLQFFNGINDSNIIELYSQVEVLYVNSFWLLFDACKLYKHISGAIFKQLIHGDHIPPNELFSYKSIVDSYGKELRDYILEFECCIRIVLGIYEQNFTKQKKLYLPKEFTQEDLELYLNRYITGEHVHINTLETIYQISKIDKLIVPPEIRLCARKRYETEAEKLSNTGIRYEYGADVSFSTEIDVPITAKLNKGIVCLTYNSKLILDNLDNASILSNFISLFGFCDRPQMRCKFVSTRNLKGSMEKIFSPERSDLYPTGITFQSFELIAQAQMTGYYEMLRNNNVFIEDVVKWFFTEYLQKQYKCPTLKLTTPEQNASYYDKCVLICGLFDSIVKQINIYIRKHEIDHELLNLTSNVVKYSDIPSFVPNKYIYPVEAQFDKIANLLFSDQSHISYVKRLDDTGKSFDTFAELLDNETIFLNDYYDFAKPLIQLLQDYEMIVISEEGKISWGDIRRRIIVEDLYKCDVISRYHYPEDYQSLFDDWIDAGILQQNSSLLTQNESQYFDFVLNKAEFVNGLDIRNKYVHGSQMGLEESEHKNNYMLLLKLMIVLILKIDDDFCLAKEKGLLNAT